MPVLLEQPLREASAETTIQPPPPPYGWLAEFDDQERLLAAVRATREAGYRHLEAFTPVAVEGLATALGRRPTRMPLVFLLGGIAGGATAYFTQWLSAVVDYPLNIGGRPFHSWPMFIPITFEVTVLGAALAGAFGMIFRNGLPRLRQPIFGAPGIERATTDRFFLLVRADDPRFERVATRRFLAVLPAVRDVVEVPGLSNNE